jgi:hypothetical protein
MTKDNLKIEKTIEPSEEKPKAEARSFKVKTIAFNGLAVRLEPNAESGLVDMIRFETVVTVESIKNGWGKLDGGWIDLQLTIRK